MRNLTKITLAACIGLTLGIGQAVAGAKPDQVQRLGEAHAAGRQEVAHFVAGEHHFKPLSVTGAVPGHGFAMIA